LWSSDIPAKLVKDCKSRGEERLLLRDVVAMLRRRERKEMGSSDAISAVPAARTAKAALDSLAVRNPTMQPHGSGRRPMRNPAHDSLILL